MSKRDILSRRYIFSYLQIAFPCCLGEETSRAMMHSCSTYLVSEMLSVWCGPWALSNRWWVCVTQLGSSVSQLWCSRPYTEDSLSLHPWNFISGSGTWDGCSVDWVRPAPVLCSCCRRSKWCQWHIMSTGGGCGPIHCHPKPGLTSGPTKMWLLQWSCVIFSVWGVVSWSIWSDCKIFFPCRFSAEISYSEHLRVSPHLPIFTNYHSVSGASLLCWIWLVSASTLYSEFVEGLKRHQWNTQSLLI